MEIGYQSVAHNMAKIQDDIVRVNLQAVPPSSSFGRYSANFRIEDSSTGGVDCVQASLTGVLL